MNHKHLTSPQTVNACTLISIAVIEAILTADNERNMENAIRLAQDVSQERYRKLIAASEGNGDGVLEEGAYQRFYVKSLTKPQAKHLTSPVTSKAIRALLEIRNHSLLQGGWEPEIFLLFNLDAIEAIEKVLPPKTPVIDWETITEEELTELVNAEPKPALIEQVNEAIVDLKDPEGITIRMEGHTISVVKRKSLFYSYDSLTGDFSSTENPEEMENHIAKKIQTNQANAVILHHFSPLPILSPKDMPGEEPTPTADKLDRIINELKSNIAGHGNGRQTTRNSEWKNNLLTEIQMRLLAEGELTLEEALDYVTDIRTVCAMKRNFLHFWAQPHSVNEFERLLKIEFMDDPIQSAKFGMS